LSDERGADLSPHCAYLSVGSNVGGREAAVLGVPRWLEECGAARPTRMSSLYETVPVGCPPMDPFINAVVEIETLLRPLDLLERLRLLEKTMGRTGRREEPRELDIDIVTYGASIIRSDALTVPHPRFRDRAFVLVPLREISPGFVCPETGLSVDDMIASLPAGQGVTRVSRRKAVLR
jgi:2-amino-4-hydroxy-6-hydroxymethyldihydropteridine diphosphokinase